MRRAFSGAGLPVPPVPMHLGAGILEVSPWVWTTEREPISPYDHLIDLHAAVVGRGDVLTVAHAGHGRQSWAIHYVLTNGPLAIVLQVPWGGMRDDGAVDRLGRLFDGVRAALAALADASATGRLGERRYVAGWSGWHGECAFEIAGGRVHELDGADPVAAVAATIQALP